jgi:hypothetical protein
MKTVGLGQTTDIFQELSYDLILPLVSSFQ